ncbi:hypothetical protein M0805_000539 [Coniferiporia weirii]|nr:hypothetical protein M0805_000539 [Coniferiporia weirii]
MDLIYLAASVHALAKLHLHMDATIALLVDLTQRFGDQLRKFKTTTCVAHVSAMSARGPVDQTRSTTGRQQSHVVPHAAVDKKFNICTSKIHAIGDYAHHILRLRTTDSYMTGIGEAEHRWSKDNFKRTNKVNFVQQLTQIECRQAALCIMAERIADMTGDESMNRSGFGRGVEAEVPDCPPEVQYGLGVPGKAIDMGHWLFMHKDDPAAKDFHQDLMDHILMRAQDIQHADETVFTDAEHNSVNIMCNHMYEHRALQVNYTTYDMRREHNSVNPYSITSDVMVLSGDVGALDSGSPFWYAQVIGIYHVDMKQDGCTPCRVDVLCMRWFKRDDGHEYGDGPCRLDRLSFIPDGDEIAPFGFIDPATVIRTVHLIPTFHYSCTNQLLGPSQLARIKRKDCNEKDWVYFYVNKFANRDLYMHHRGGGIGHTTGFRTINANHVPATLYTEVSFDPTSASPDDVLAADGNNNDDDDDNIEGSDVGSEQDDDDDGSIYDTEYETDERVSDEGGDTHVDGHDSDG